MAHNYESNIICPYCDFEDTDSWEWNEDWETYECPDCGKEFNVEQHVEVTYSTSRKECEDDKHDYKFNGLFERTESYSHRNDGWVKLPEEEYEHYKSMICTICEDEKMIKITKEEYDELRLS